MLPYRVPGKENIDHLGQAAGVAKAHYPGTVEHFLSETLATAEEIHSVRISSTGRPACIQQRWKDSRQFGRLPLERQPEEFGLESQSA
jgi:hypothetical protein